MSSIKLLNKLIQSYKLNTSRLGNFLIKNLKCITHIDSLFFFIAFNRSIANLFGISTSTAWSVTMRTCQALLDLNLEQGIISWPRDQGAMDVIADFERLHGFPGKYIIVTLHPNILAFQHCHFYFISNHVRVSDIFFINEFTFYKQYISAPLHNTLLFIFTSCHTRGVLGQGHSYA